MSQYGSMPSPSPYVPPGQQQQQQQQHQHAHQQPPPYQTTANAAKYEPPGYAQKSGGILGQMVNQHLTNGKPMLNKLGKSISSRLGNMPFTSGPTQQTPSYQNYQNHYGQQNQAPAYQQPSSQVSSPRPQQQQQQWGQVQHPSPPPVSSPYQQPGYFTSTPGHSAHANYPVQQTQQSPVSQSYTPPLPVTTSGYVAQYGQVGSAIEQGQTYGQHNHSQLGQSPYQPPMQELQGSYTGQENGIVAGMPNYTANRPPQMAGQPPQPQWGSSSPVKQDLARPEQQPGLPGYHSQHVASPGTPVSQEQHQHWNGVSPPSKRYDQVHVTAPHHSASPSPTQQVNMVPQTQSNGAWKTNTTATPVSYQAVSEVTSPGFAVELPAELPADLGNLSLESGGPQPSMKASEVAQSGTWALVDAATESPTSEFYALADLLFDALDSKFEPRNTGLLEGSKMISSNVMRLSDEEKRVFSHQSYGAFAKMWSVEGIPHVMVPCEAALTPIWNFSPLSHAQHVRVGESSRASQAKYMPALNRAGWYKFFFVDAMRAPEELGNVMAAVCADRCQAGTVDGPDLNKLDRRAIPALRARAGEMRAYAISQACEETRAAMDADATRHGSQ